MGQRRYFGISLRRWVKLAQWSILGTLGCIAIAVSVNYVLFTRFAPEGLAVSIFSAILIPVVLGGPLFLILNLKLRELAVVNHRLRELASFDGLTGCLNRGAFTRAVEDHLSRRDQSAGALLVIDADHFKAINDSFGHHNGDQALVLIANAIRASLRQGDVTGRLGGEEFGVFLPKADLREAGRVAERVRTIVASLDFSPEGEPCNLSVSVGGAAFAQPMTFAELFRIADERLYAAKKTGRDRVEMTFIAGSGFSFVPHMTVH
jgi:diguanylate cyclase (GGDEF)-like protein